MKVTLEMCRDVFVSNVRHCYLHLTKIGMYQ